MLNLSVIFKNYKSIWFVLLFLSLVTPFILLSIIHTNEEINRLQARRYFEDTNYIEFKKKFINSTRFSPELNQNRINRLLKILVKKEIYFGKVLKHLRVITFNNSFANQSKFVAQFAAKKQEQNNEKLVIFNDEVFIGEPLVQQLRNNSLFYSFDNQEAKNKLERTNNEDEKPVLVTAGNNRYFTPLLRAIRNIHMYLSDYKLIVYDLGISKNNIIHLKQMCKCEVRKFDKNGSYQKAYPHIANRYTYAWKPLVIQEVLANYQTVIYLDSSIRFNSGNIEKSIELTRKVGLLARYYPISLKCYTDNRMFEYFGETDIDNIGSIEANFIMIHKTFLTRLIMKSWVTCALDESCIAPLGSSIHGKRRSWSLSLEPCNLRCNCHRFDQSALTLILTFFYGHPVDSLNKLPAYALTGSWVTIKRHTFTIFQDIKKLLGIDQFH